MKTDKEYIDKLIERYFDGDTSNSEEVTLRRYMKEANGDISEEWRALKALFAYEETERKPVETKARMTIMRRVMRYVAVAAAIIIIAIPVTTRRHNTADGYAVIDGKIYTDKRTVMEEVENALMIVAAGEEDPFEALNQIK